MRGLKHENTMPELCAQNPAAARRWTFIVFASFVVCAQALSPSPCTRRQILARSLLAVSAPTAAVRPAFAALEPDDMDAAIGKLRRAYDALDRQQPDRAEPLLTECVDTWTRAAMPNAELASLYRLRGSARLQLSRPRDATADLDVAYDLVKGINEEEALQVLQLRANALEQQSDWARAERDLSVLIGSEAQLSIGGPNPYLRVRRAAAAQQLGRWKAAAADLAEAETQLTVIGDRIRAVLAASNLALALYGAGEVPAALQCIERVFAGYTKPSSNNPDDLPLLEELSRREAELHLALASHYGGSPQPPQPQALARADAEWRVGCLRLSVYEDSLSARRLEEARRRISPSPLELAQRSLARLSGLAPDSPYVTMLPGEGYWWYQELGAPGGTRRFSPVNVRAPAERTPTSCAAFDDGGAYAATERDWPPLLVERLRTYRARAKA
jgi:tetratricopeptide (TPR) repeat protein